MGVRPICWSCLEDVELPNMQAPVAVVRAFLEATARRLQALRTERRLGFADAVAEALLAKASFHLAMPMIESWLFADPSGPANAGVPAERLPPEWERDRDPEDFLARSPAYVNDDGTGCTAWAALPPHRTKQNRPAWLIDDRDRHPKSFLSWLCRDPSENKCSQYRETTEGARALARLDWDAALRPRTSCTFLRALVDDLAEGLGEPLPVTGELAPLTSRRARRESPVLRNI